MAVDVKPVLALKRSDRLVDRGVEEFGVGTCTIRAWLDRRIKDVSENGDVRVPLAKTELRTVAGQAQLTNAVFLAHAALFEERLAQGQNCGCCGLSSRR